MSDSSRSRFWEKAAPALRVVGAVLLAAGMIHLYADEVIFDAPHLRLPRGRSASATPGCPGSWRSRSPTR